MARLFSAALILLGLSAPLPAEGLPVPQGLEGSVSGGSLTLSWQGVEGAGLYRVAVFGEPEADKKRPLFAAVWVKGTRYVYAQTMTVPKAGKLASTKPLPLPEGQQLRVMVAAADADGGDKGDWAGLDVQAPPSGASGQAPVKVSATATVTAVIEPSASATPASSAKEAELDVKGGEEFKQSPDAAVLDVDDAAPAAGAALASGAAAAAASTDPAQAASAPASSATAAVAATAVSGAAATAAVLTDQPTPVSGALYTLGEAKGLISAGRYEQAESAYRALLDKDPDNADAWEGLGDSYAGRKMKLEAKESYEKALSLDKTKMNLKDWIDKNVRH